MKKHLPKLTQTVKRVGFTMIELLIVISILGILAVAVLAAINPIEQINRGKDTGSRSDAEQLLSAMDRYYASTGHHPWQTSADDVTHSGTWDPEATGNLTTGVVVVIDDLNSLEDSTGCSALAKLATGEGMDPTCPAGSGSDEVKPTFIDRITNPNYNHLRIYNRGGQGDSTYLCFIAKSKAFYTEAEKRCGNTTENGTTTYGAGMPSDMDPDIASSFCGGGTPQGSTPVIYSCLP